jgi:VWFA-related protein
MRRAVGLSAFLLCAAGLGAQQKPVPPGKQPPVFRTGIDLVQIDVVVLDADGQPVRGLTKEDFTLFDRSVKQEIATFAARSHERPPADPFAAPLPLDVADNQSAKSDRLVIIILDDLHFRGRTAEAVPLVERTVNELGDSVSLGLVTTSGTFGIEPTEDRARLLAAVKYFLDRFDPSRAKIPQVTSGPPAFFAPPPGTPIEPGGEMMFFRYSGPDLPSEFSPLHAYKTVEDVARMVGANDGRRKAFVWISAGVEGGGAVYGETCKNLGVFASAGDHISQRICAMYEKLFRSSVAVYAVSPGGPTDGAGTRTLNDITKETGGFFIGASDIDAGMTRLITDLDNYYLLGFYPAEPGRAGYRDVDVVVNRPGFTVRHRAGYHAAGPVPPPKNKNLLGTLVAPISPTSELHLRVSAIPFFSSGSSMQLLTTIEVDIGELPEAGANGLVRDPLQFAVFAVDLQKKKVTKSVGRRVLLEWPEEHRKPGAERFLVQTVLNVPPGAYQLRASTTSKTPEKSGSVYL